MEKVEGKGLGAAGQFYSKRRLCLPGTVRRRRMRGKVAETAEWKPVRKHRREGGREGGSLRQQGERKKEVKKRGKEEVERRKENYERCTCYYEELEMKV